MSKKLFGSKKKQPAAEAVTPESKGPVVKRIDAAPSTLGDPRKNRGRFPNTILGNLTGTLGG